MAELIKNWEKLKELLETGKIYFPRGENLIEVPVTSIHIEFIEDDRTTTHLIEEE